MKKLDIFLMQDVIFVGEYVQFGFQHCLVAE